MTPPPELLEAVARAIAGHCGLIPPEADHLSRVALAAISEAGFVVVPREPTAAMVNAGANANRRALRGLKILYAYRAMLAARPGGEG